MFSNYLKIAFRNILRYKSFSIINILGLTIGLTAFLAICLYVVDEFSFDRHHANAERIYRGIITTEGDGQSTKWGGTPNLLAPTAAREIPEVEMATRYFHHNFGDLAFISNGAEQFSEVQLYFADPEFLKIFSIPFIEGDPATAINRKGTVILSESAAKKYFPAGTAIGKQINVDGNLNLEVTGVYQDFPTNSFLTANMIASFSSNWFGEERNQSWGNASFDSFFLLNEATTKQSVDEKIEALLAKNIAKDNRWFTIALQPLLDIRLHSGDLNATFDRRTYGDIAQVKVLMALAIIILLIAAVNYMNLTTAQSQRRNKEVGINKTLGATHRQMSFKFYFEASLFVAISMLISLVAFFTFLPLFNELSGKSISAQFITNPVFWLAFGSIWFVLTFLSGFYPAWYLSAFSPKSALQKSTGSGGQAWVRKSLVVVQFGASIVLIICSMVFYKQMNFIREKKLGYEPEQVVAVMTTSSKSRDEVLSLKTEFENLTDVVSVARSQSFPGMGSSGRNIKRQGEQGDGSSFRTVRATSEILSTLNINLLAGTTLPEVKDPADTTVQLVVNKATTDYLGLSPEEAVGLRVEVGGFSAVTIVGVTDDFHFNSLHQKISPMGFHNANRTESFNYLLVKINTNSLEGTVKQLENTFKKHINSAFEYTFLDQKMASLYKAEKSMGNVVFLFAFLAIFVACLGLYALAAFTAEQRTKEIGIRKVMGASVSQLIAMLSKDFLILVGIAFVVGIPAGYYFMTQWLEKFSYRTDLDLLLFVWAGVVSLAIAGITVSLESYKAASSNPVKSLRSE